MVATRPSHHRCARTHATVSTPSGASLPNGYHSPSDA